MITPFVMVAFDRLAMGEALLDIARSAPTPPDELYTDRFMQEAFRLDADMGSAFAKAMLDDASSPPEENEPTKEEMFRHVFEQMLDGIESGETSSAKAVSEGDVTKLMHTIKMLLQKMLQGDDRETKATGMRKKLEEFGIGLSKSDTRDSTAKEVAAFVQEAFSGEIEWLTRSYWWSRVRMTGQRKSTLLTQEAGSKAKAQELARLHIFSMLLEGTRNSIEKDLYAQKPSDAATLGAIVKGVWYRIRNRKTGDQYDGEVAATSGAEAARSKWGQYIAPLQATGKFGDSGSLDTLGITRFLNEHFLRRDLDSGEAIEAPLPGGGTMTAPSFKTELKHLKVHMWAKSGLPGVSLEGPMSGDDDAGSIADTVGAPDTPRAETEEGIVEWLESPSEADPAKTNRDAVREDIRGWVDEAMRRSAVIDSNSSAVHDILLVKLGFMSSETERAEFLKKWLATDIPKFRADAIAADIWEEIGEPFRKVRRGDPRYDPERKRRPSDEPPYSKEWEQQALVDKDTGKQFIGRIDALRKENQDKLEVVTKVHKVGDDANPQHMLNWVAYSQDDRKADLNRALDVYDGEKWFEQSVNEDVRKELQQSDESLAEVLRKFNPESIFKAVAKHSDTELVRAMGHVKPSVSLETGRTPFQTYPAIYPDIKRAIGKLGEVMVEESRGDVGALQYLSLKRLGRVAGRIDTETIVSSVVSDIAWST